MPGQRSDGAAVARVADRTSASRTLHDTHCHVDLFPSPAEVMRQAEVARVYTIAVTTLPSCFAPTERLVAGSKFVRAALGFHPELVAERAHEIPLFLEALPRTRYIGEVGLDYTTSDKGARSQQRRALSTIVAACEAAGDKIVTVHSRRAAEDVVDTFGASFRGNYILHWYSGGNRTLHRALANGAYISANLAMLRSERGRAIIAEVPPERVLIESDGPFVTTSADGSGAKTPAGPTHARDVAHLLSNLWGVNPGVGVNVLHGNFRRLLGSDGA